MTQVQIPEIIVNDPIQAVVDGFTILHHNGGIPACEKALEAIMDAMYPKENA